MKKTNQTTMAYFHQISAIPRCSKSEEALRLWLIQWATDRAYETHVDSMGNLLIPVPSTLGKETSPTVVIQTLLDPHSTMERAYIPSIEKSYTFLKAVVKSL